MSQREDANRAAADPSAAPPVLPATLRLGAVHLTVTDLDRSVGFYEEAIGLRPHRREGPVAATAEPAARPRHERRPSL